jgi:hypothetical protein
MSRRSSVCGREAGRPLSRDAEVYEESHPAKRLKVISLNPTWLFASEELSRTERFFAKIERTCSELQAKSACKMARVCKPAGPGDITYPVG